MVPVSKITATSIPQVCHIPKTSSPIVFCNVEFTKGIPMKMMKAAGTRLKTEIRFDSSNTCFLMVLFDAPSAFFAPISVNRFSIFALVRKT